MRLNGRSGGIVLALLIGVWQLLCLAPSLAAGAAAEDGRRLALVIGNAQYQALPKLANASNDALLVTAALLKTGFDVTVLIDAGLDKMNAAIDAFMRDARPTDHVVFYYSGHGIQLEGANYVVPIDAVLDSQAAIGARTLRLNDVLRRLQAGGRQTIAFIDACRANPLPAGVRGTDAADGLARLGDGLASNLFVAFATKPGEVSEDGTGSNSPFALALARHIAEANVPIYAMMMRVRTEVAAATHDAQTPVDEESLLQPFYFNGAPAPAVSFGQAPETLIAEPPPAATLLPTAPAVLVSNAVPAQPRTAMVTPPPPAVTVPALPSPPPVQVANVPPASAAPTAGEAPFFRRDNIGPTPPDDLIASATGNPADDPRSRSPLPVTADALIISTGHLDPNSEQFHLALINPMIAGLRIEVPGFQLLADFSSRNRTPETLKLLRLQFEKRSLSDPKSQLAAYARCGATVNVPLGARLHYGDESRLNACVLGLMTAGDAALWRSVWAALPGLVHADALAGDTNARRVDALLQRKAQVLEPAEPPALWDRPAYLAVHALLPQQLEVQTMVLLPAETPIGQGYNVIIDRPTLAGVLQRPMAFQVFATFSGKARSAAGLDRLWMSVRIGDLEAKPSRTGDFTACGDSAYDTPPFAAARFRLNFGREAPLNDCVLGMMTPADARRWKTVWANLPDLIHTAQAYGNRSAQTLDPLFQHIRLAPDYLPPQAR